MRTLILISLLLVPTVTLAQQPKLTAEQLNDAIEALRQQRDQALDQSVYLSMQLKEAQKELTDLKAAKQPQPEKPPHP